MTNAQTKPIPGSPPDAAGGARTFRVEGTLPAAKWGECLDAVGAAIAAYNAGVESKRARVRALRFAGVAFAAVVGIVLGFTPLWPLGIVVFALGSILPSTFLQVPPDDSIGTERLDFVRELLAELAKTGGRVALSAQFDARRAIDDAPLASGTQSVRTREENWLRGELQGLRGLFLGWTLTEWHTLTRVLKRNARGRTKFKAKLAIARRTSVRLDADGAMFASSVGRSGGTVQPQGLVEVRETPRGWSVRGRHEYLGKFALHYPDDLGASLAEIRRGTGYQGRDREDVFGRYPSTLVYLMKQCEQRLEPRT